MNDNKKTFKSWLKKNKYLTITGITIIIIVIIVLYFKKEDHKQTLTFGSIGRGSITATVVATGQINPVVWAQVGAQVSGQIIRLYADFNSVVKKGQLLALIDPTPFEAQLTLAKAALLSAHASILNTRATMALNKSIYERRLQLPHDLISQENLQTAKTNYETAVASFTAAQAALLQAQANYKIASFNLEHTRIVSPLSGVVITREVNSGQTVASSFQTPDLFDLAENLKKMESDTNVVETDIGKVKVGQRADFTVDAYPNITFTGTVAIVRNAPMVIQNVVNYDVIIYVDNKDLLLKPGMTSYVNIDVAKKNNILLIPNAAFRFTPKDPNKIITEYAKNHRLPSWVSVPPEESQLKAWYRVTKVWGYKDERFIPIPVKTGIKNNNFTELVNGDIKQGDKVVTGYGTAE
ncbi:MAG: efflux RND transporter periplasmic adaptor subunit [Deltaproteobacteria bacterium]|nr:efflux RND transporter periplasmic adaptor subunit [Deltaproteobacteria bacterium]MCL5792903.1 efflux RND transporter periplasmic adaptor subunit [Deltaproteobacteria bacterium]